MSWRERWNRFLEGWLDDLACCAIDHSDLDDDTEELYEEEEALEEDDDDSA